MANKNNAIKDKYGFLDFLYDLIRSFYIKDGLQRANSLAYVVLISFVPFFISIASITTWFIPDKLYYKFERVILNNYFPSIGEDIIKHMEYFHSHAGKLSIISLIFLLITSLSTIATLRHHLEQLWEIKYTKINFGLSMLIDFILMTVGPTLIGFSIITTSYIASLLGIDDYAILFSIVEIILPIISFTLLYKLVPRSEVRIKYALIAGVAAGILFFIAKQGFTVYIKYFATENFLYGTLATIPIFLLWIYINSLLLLLCAQIIYVLRNYSAVKPAN